MYESDEFSAAVCKVVEPNAAFLVFLAGKMVCSDIVDEETLKKMVTEFYSKLVKTKAVEQALK
ncbi:MAG: hypothetical protein FWH37_07795 [Candidatus Bathyarchaeota archaeon]|nr:hypothetical protein [Candidatus Termiticorpusculum sp.]